MRRSSRDSSRLGVVRQIVTMPLGQGYTVEDQMAGQAKIGGIQIDVFLLSIWPLASTILCRHH
jgi:hypothetical protein